MFKSSLYIAALTLVTGGVQAQVVIEEGLQGVEEVQVSERPLRRQQQQVQGNQQYVQQKTVIQQPTTYVEAAPIGDSRADSIRKQRQDVEVQTEQRIVEKLEQSRLEDEKRRANRVFGNYLNQPNEPAQPPAYQSQQPVHTPPVVAQPVVAQPVVAAPVQVVDEDRVSREELNSAKSEIIESIRAQKEEAKEDADEPSSLYISGVLGVVDYPSAANVDGTYGAGFSVGTELANRVSVEGSFLYSNYYVEEFWRVAPFRELDQYNIGMAVKYSILPYMFRPFVGAQVSYTHRKYSDRVGGYYPNNGGNFYTDSGEASSSAVDLGLIVGMDLAISETFSIGGEYKYSTNMVNKKEGDLFNSEYFAPGNSTPIEELDYSSFGISAKVKF